MSGDPEFFISFAARSWPADLILIRANNRKDFRSRLLGSVAKSVVKSAPCSVEVVRAREKAEAVSAGFHVVQRANRRIDFRLMLAPPKRPTLRSAFQLSHHQHVARGDAD
jgi:hypothetical protein